MNNIAGKHDPFGSPVGRVAFVVGAEAGDAINVGIQLQDARAKDVYARSMVYVYLSDDANGDVLTATAPSGGWAIGTDGTIHSLITNKAANVLSEADGDIDITLTEAGVGTWYLNVITPDGQKWTSPAITFA